MLEPDDRTLLSDLLAPPEPGYRLIGAVGTTFTLDLTALLSIPLAFAGADLVDVEGDERGDPFAVLESVRRFADRIDVFCQAGQVFVPRTANDMLTFLEPVIHQVKAPRHGLFHPKLWILRFGHESDDELYRLVCGSRNLTHDRSWDAAISLEGRRTKRLRAVAGPVADLLNSLSARVPTGVTEKRQKRISELAEGLRYVEWDRPEGTFDIPDWLRIHVFGDRIKARPRMDGYRRLIVSPFLTEAGLRKAWPDADGECHVVSRPESFNGLDDEARESVERDANPQVLSEQVAVADIDSDDSGLKWSLSGLHSKLYIVERARRAHLLIGSANATGAAWSSNDEVLIEIVGQVGKIGVEATIGQDGFASILESHLMGHPEDSAESELRFKLEGMVRDLAALPWVATVVGSDESISLQLTSREDLESSSLPGVDLKLDLRPMTLTGAALEVDLDAGIELSWAMTDITEITPFFVARLRGSADSGERTEVSSVLLARLEKDPADRVERVLARQFSRPGEFLRFVMMLLQLASGDEFQLDSSAGSGSGTGFGLIGDGGGLLEAALAALDDAPSAIEDIDRLVSQLRATESGSKILPDGWEEFWPSVVAACAELGADT